MAATTKQRRGNDEQQESFGTFELLAGVHHQGAQALGTRKVLRGRNPAKGRGRGDIITARSEKEAEFFRKYPDKFREVTNERSNRGDGDEFGPPTKAPRPSRPPHMTDQEDAATSPIQALPGEGTDNDGQGDSAGDEGVVRGSKEGTKEQQPRQQQQPRRNTQTKESSTSQQEQVEEVDMDKLKAMNARELLNWAREHNVDVKGAVKKEDIVKNIETALSENG